MASSFLTNLGLQVENKKGEPVVVDDGGLLAGKIVALYFSSSWCPACKTFTPLLSVLHEEAQEEGLDFQVIYVSSDTTKEQCNRYMKENHGNWLRISFDATAVLKTKFGVFAGREQSLFPTTKRRSGIPTMVIVSKEGNELDLLDCDSTKVIKEIENKGTAFLDRWESYKW